MYMYVYIACQHHRHGIAARALRGLWSVAMTNYIAICVYETERGREHKCLEGMLMTSHTEQMVRAGELCEPELCAAATVSVEVIVQRF